MTFEGVRSRQPINFSMRYYYPYYKRARKIIVTNHDSKVEA